MSQDKTQFVLDAQVYDNTMYALENMISIYKDNRDIARAAKAEHIYDQLANQTVFGDDTYPHRAYITIDTQNVSQLITLVYDRFLPPAEPTSVNRFEIQSQIKKQPN